ncbi:hypothetical protein GWK47_037448 [Chionoecetes opilio]|uniref:Uncharacterized protein n=1 Tax=Chionoecetes opilio TaxID=41210 RepID=A0A8J5D1F2_CHIOP|nr:hypothetical protein GWK47_037448 [Chionoecetes opilio]
MHSAPPSSRGPALPLDRAVTAPLGSSARGFFGAFRSLTRPQILLISPLDSEVLVEPSLQQCCLASIPPTVLSGSFLRPTDLSAGGFGRGPAVFVGALLVGMGIQEAHPRVDGPQDPRRPIGVAFRFRGSGYPTGPFRSGPATVHKQAFSKGALRF